MLWLFGVLMGDTLEAPLQSQPPPVPLHPGQPPRASHISKPLGMRLSACGRGSVLTISYLPEPIMLGATGELLSVLAQEGADLNPPASVHWTWGNEMLGAPGQGVQCTWSFTTSVLWIARCIGARPKTTTEWLTRVCGSPCTVRGPGGCCAGGGRMGGPGEAVQ